MKDNTTHSMLVDARQSTKRPSINFKKLTLCLPTSVTQAGDQESACCRHSQRSSSARIGGEATRRCTEHSLSEVEVQLSPNNTNHMPIMKRKMTSQSLEKKFKPLQESPLIADDDSSVMSTPSTIDLDSEDEAALKATKPMKPLKKCDRAYNLVGDTVESLDEEVDQLPNDLMELARSINVKHQSHVPADPPMLNSPDALISLGKSLSKLNEHFTKGLHSYTGSGQKQHEYVMRPSVSGIKDNAATVDKLVISSLAPTSNKLSCETRLARLRAESNEQFEDFLADDFELDTFS